MGFEVRSTTITLRVPGDVIYVDISRTFGEDWYQVSQLPDLYHIRYVDVWTITSWKKEPIALYGYSDVFRKYYILKDDCCVLDWGRWTTLTPDMVLLTLEHLDRYPNLKH